MPGGAGERERREEEREGEGEEGGEGRRGRVEEEGTRGEEGTRTLDFGHDLHPNWPELTFTTKKYVQLQIISIICYYNIYMCFFIFILFFLFSFVLPLDRPPPGPPSAGPPKISLFFFSPLPLQCSFFPLSLGVLLVEFCWCFGGQDPQMCTVWALGLAPPVRAPRFRPPTKIILTKTIIVTIVIMFFLLLFLFLLWL